MLICTIADSNYSAQVRTLFNSIKKYEKAFQFCVLCMDAKVEKELRDLDLTFIPKCAVVKDGSISGKEALFYATPLLIKYLLNQSESDVLYIDADTMFFSPFIEHTYNTIGVSSALIVYHGYSDKFFLKHLNDFGKFNVGFNFFRNNIISQLIVSDWCNSCAEYFGCRNTRLSFFSDQIYLDEWPQKFGNHVKVSFNDGLNISPRVAARFGLRRCGNDYKCGRILIRHFHFIGVKKIGDMWATGFHDYLKVTKRIEREFVEDYVRVLLSNGFSGNHIPLPARKRGVKRAARNLLWKLNRGLIKL